MTAPINRFSWKKMQKLNPDLIVSEQDDIERYMLQTAINKCLDTIMPREKKVLELHYGLNGNTSHTLREIGLMMNRSGNAIRLVEEKAIWKMRHHSRAKYITGE